MAGTQAVCLGIGFLSSVRCHLPDSSSWCDCTDAACHLVGPAHPAHPAHPTHPAYGIATTTLTQIMSAQSLRAPPTPAFKTTQPHLFVYVHIGRRGKEKQGGEKQDVEESSEHSVFKSSQGHTSVVGFTDPLPR